MEENSSTFSKAKNLYEWGFLEETTAKSEVAIHKNGNIIETSESNIPLVVGVLNKKILSVFKLNPTLN